MFIPRRSLLIACLLVPAAAPAGGLEVTPQIGYANGSLGLDTGIVCLQSPCPTFLESEEDAVLGVIVDYALTPRFDLELNTGRQASNLRFTDSSGSGPNTGLAPVDFDITHLEVGMRRTWEIGRTQPFAAFGIGVSRLESDAFVDTRIDSDRTSASLAGGALVSLGERTGLRLELRGRHIDLPSEFNESGNTSIRVANGDLDQLQGLIGFRFKLGRNA